MEMLQTFSELIIALFLLNYVNVLICPDSDFWVIQSSYYCVQESSQYLKRVSSHYISNHLSNAHYYVDPKVR